MIDGARGRVARGARGRAVVATWIIARAVGVIDDVRVGAGSALPERERCAAPERCRAPRLPTAT